MNMSTVDHMLVASTLTSHGFVITFLPFFPPSGVPQLVLFAFYKKRTKKSIIIQIYPTSR